MGNANGREESGSGVNDRPEYPALNPYPYPSPNSIPPPPPPPLPGHITSTDSMANSPPESPGRSRSPLMFTPQVFLAGSNLGMGDVLGSYDIFEGWLDDNQKDLIVHQHRRMKQLAEAYAPIFFCSKGDPWLQLPVAPLQRGESHSMSNDMWHMESAVDLPPEKGIPTMITWSLGGNNVAVEGSWDNWTSRKFLQRSGKDHTVLLVLPSGIYHYRFIVDGEMRYMPDQPYVSSDVGQLCNVLDVHDYVPESLDSVAEFEPPPSPGSSYGHVYPGEDDFAKEPVIVPAQLHLTVLGMQNTEEASPSPSRPQHVVLNHLFIEKGWAASQSVVALGLTHRFESKYVTVVLYKPLKR